MGRHYRMVAVTDEETVASTISQDEARQKLREDISGIEIREGTGPLTHLITYPSGIGKTHWVAKHIRAKGWKVVWLCATHKQARETIKNHFRGIKAVELKGRLYMLDSREIKYCPKEYDVRFFDRTKPEAIHRICMRCDRRKDGFCEYYNHCEKAKRADIVVGMHAHLQFPDFLKQYLKKSDCMVIDESFSGHYMGEEEFSTEDVKLSMKILRKIARDEAHGQEIRDAAHELLACHRQIRSTAKDAGSNPNQFPKIEDSFRKIYSTELQHTDGRNNVLHILEHVAGNGSAIVKRGDRYTYIRVADLPENIETIILDASGTKDFYEKMLRREVIVYDSDRPIDQVAHVTQFLEGAYPLITLWYYSRGTAKVGSSTYYRILKLIKAIKHKHKGERFVIGTSKTVEKKLRSDGIADDDTDTVHYYDMRGIDEYKGHDVMIMVGVPMLSFNDIAREARILFGQNWDDAELVEQMEFGSKAYVRVPYSRDGMGYEVATHQFSNEYIQQYYEHVVVMEMLQMFGRIRPYEGSEKCVYIISNVPIPGLRINLMTTIQQFMEEEGGPMERRSELREIASAIEQLPDEFRIRDLMPLLGRTSQSQRDNLRKRLRKDKEYFLIEFCGHKIRKISQHPPPKPVL